jgi:putative ABC transport system ATP-binding protein
VIHLSELHKRYRDEGGENHVLRGVSLDIAEGEFVALMGTSGSGKSTLLNVIGALDQDYDGVVKVDGSVLRGLDDTTLSRFRNRTVSFVFQQFHLLPHLPVLDNVLVPSWFAGPGDEAARRTRGMTLLERVGLASMAVKRPGHLSGGEKQRVAIARALFNKPKILLADEPTGALDTASGQRVMALFASLNREAGVTVVIVTHDPEVAAQCDRIIRIRDGRIETAGEGG